MQPYVDARIEQQDAPEPQVELECECQDTERCPVHFGYDD